MIHRGDHRLHGLSVGERKDCNLGACHEFLHNDLAAGFAELSVKQHGIHRRLGFLEILGDDDALSEGKSVTLDDCRVAVLRLYVFYRPVGVGESFVSCGGNAVLFHQRLGEHLAALKYRSIRTRSEGLESGFVELVHHSHYQGIVRSNEHEIRLELLRQLQDTVKVGRLNREALRQRGDSAVSGRRPDLVNLRGFCKRRNYRVLASAAAYYQNIHNINVLSE